MIFFTLMILLSNNINMEGNEVLLNSGIMNSAGNWRILNDGVMGGLSSSSTILNGYGKIVFSGNVSLENNGGFASLRSPVKNYNFENRTGLEIRVKGDGKKYSLSMKETSYFTGSFFTANFETIKDELSTIKIPFESFALYYFGKKVSPKPEIPLSRIKEVSLLIGEKQEGAFSLEIDFIKLY